MRTDCVASADGSLTMIMGSIILKVRARALLAGELGG
jgi:hypothetical protein